MSVAEFLFLFLMIFIIIVTSIIWTDYFGAPWIPTPMKTVHKMLKLAEIHSNDVIYDLGCGDGRTVIIAARDYKDKAIGIEIDPLRYLWCQILITILRLRKQVKIVYGNFFNMDLSEATLITCYLLQDTNNKLVQKFKNELRPGTKIVSNTFTFYGLERICQNGKVTFYKIPLKPIKVVS